MAQNEPNDSSPFIKRRFQQKKEAKDLSGLFAAKQKTELKENIKFKAIKEEGGGKILSAVAGHFDIITGEQIEQVEEAYPYTVRALFGIAKHIIQGDYGPRLHADGLSHTDFLFDWDIMVKLILLFVSKSSDETPRIFKKVEHSFAYTELKKIFSLKKSRDFEKVIYEPQEAVISEKIEECTRSIELGILEKKALTKLFKRYLENFANPSSAGVKMMLRNAKSMDDTVKVALNIKSKPERLKSIDNIVGSMLSQNSVSSAIKIVGSIKVKKDISKPLTNLVKQLLRPNRKDIEALIQSDQIDEAISIADSLVNEGEKDAIYQRLITGLAIHKKVDLALEIAKKISNPEVRDFSLSSLVHGLITSKDFENAPKVAVLISDPDYRDDANSFIIRGILDSGSFEQAINFASGIKDSLERTHAAKVILSWAKSNQDYSKVEEIFTRFELT